jgi:hypothetical protein
MGSHMRRPRKSRVSFQEQVMKGAEGGMVETVKAEQRQKNEVRAEMR